jgi:hypothetical protein
LPTYTTTNATATATATAAAAATTTTFSEIEELKTANYSVCLSNDLIKVITKINKKLLSLAKVITEQCISIYVYVIVFRLLNVTCVLDFRKELNIGLF